jgi:hypothetical protein
MSSSPDEMAAPPPYGRVPVGQLTWAVRRSAMAIEEKPTTSRRSASRGPQTAKTRSRQLPAKLPRSYAIATIWRSSPVNG